MSFSPGEGDKYYALSNKKSPDERGFTVFFYQKWKLLLCVLLFEFVDTTCGIYQDILTGIERVAGIRDLHFYERIFVTIFPLDGFFGSSGRAAQEGVTITHVLENDQTVILGMDILFHVSDFLPDSDRVNFS